MEEKEERRIAGIASATAINGGIANALNCPAGTDYCDAIRAQNPFLFVPFWQIFPSSPQGRTSKESAQILPIFLPFPELDELESAASEENG
jgi:hypothetical protein